MTLREMIDREAYTQDLSADLLAALVQVESGGDANAWNPEPRYPYLWNVKTDAPFRKMTAAEAASKTPPPDFPVIAGDRDQEWWGQQASWGLMQIMGALARERGCRRPYLTSLLDPELNLMIGAGHLVSLLAWARGDEAKALGAYNAGRGGWESEAGRKYAAKVLRVKREMAS